MTRDETEGYGIAPVELTDPIDGRKLQALRMYNAAGMSVTVLAERALDLYSLDYDQHRVSYLNPRAGISSKHFEENGAQGFLKNFFGGMLTTCGLIQSGRPCEAAGRRYGLHGRISNIPARQVSAVEENGALAIVGVVEEEHPEGERLRLARTIRMDGYSPTLTIHDEVTNVGDVVTPYMMMYHMNFGPPFLSEGATLAGSFHHIIDRDTGEEAGAEEVLCIKAAGERQSEKVFYTRADLKRGFRLENSILKIGAHLTAIGDGLNWTGIWQNYTKDQYALGIEPCNCPGVGCAQARDQGILPFLAPGEARKNEVRLSLYHLG